MLGKCPHCNGMVSHINLVPVSGSAFLGETEWKTVLYTCPLCQKILSVSIDPIAIRTDIVNMITAKRS